jgi:hypothetical protein
MQIVKQATASFGSSGNRDVAGHSVRWVTQVDQGTKNKAVNAVWR